LVKFVPRFPVLTGENKKKKLSPKNAIESSLVCSKRSSGQYAERNFGVRGIEYAPQRNVQPTTASIYWQKGQAQRFVKKMK
jgi:hypothetical protein